MKRFLLVLAIAGTFTAAKAQSHTSRAHAEFGVKAGLNVATLNVKDVDDSYDNRKSAHLGVLMHYHITDRFALQPELVFSAQGAEMGNTQFEMNYLNLPVLAQVMFGEGFRLQTGPQVGYLLSAKREIGDDEVDVKNSYNKTDFSWVFGASYITKARVGIDARYNLGLSNVNENSSPKISNNVFQVGLFYQFRK
ncbi:MAG: porin family protein [Flavitalea sp.]